MYVIPEPSVLVTKYLLDLVPCMHLDLIGKGGGMPDGNVAYQMSSLLNDSSERESRLATVASHHNVDKDQTERADIADNFAVRQQ